MKFDKEKRKEAFEKIIYKANMLKEISKPYGDLGSFLNAMIINGREASEGKGVNLLTVHASNGA